MIPEKSMIVAAMLNVIPFANKSPAGGLDWITCVVCQARLRLHQPDPLVADLLLGTCVACRRWSMIVLGPESTAGIVVVLPETESFTAIRSSLDIPVRGEAPSTRSVPGVGLAGRTRTDPDKVEYSIDAVQRIWADRWSVPVKILPEKREDALKALRSWLEDHPGDHLKGN